MYESDDKDIFTYEFGCCDGNHGRFVGTTKEIRKALDEFEWDTTAYYKYNPPYKKECLLSQIATILSILKYGYCWEWKEKFSEVDGSWYVIDNVISISIQKVK